MVTIHQSVFCQIRIRKVSIDQNFPHQNFMLNGICKCHVSMACWQKTLALLYLLLIQYRLIHIRNWIPVAEIYLIKKWYIQIKRMMRGKCIDWCKEWNIYCHIFLFNIVYYRTQEIFGGGKFWWNIKVGE